MEFYPDKYNYKVAYFYGFAMDDEGNPQVWIAWKPYYHTYKELGSSVNLNCWRRGARPPRLGSGSSHDLPKLLHHDRILRFDEVITDSHGERRVKTVFKDSLENVCDLKKDYNMSDPTLWKDMVVPEEYTDWMQQQRRSKKRRLNTDMPHQLPTPPAPPAPPTRSLDDALTPFGQDCYRWYASLSHEMKYDVDLALATWRYDNGLA